MSQSSTVVRFSDGEEIKVIGDRIGPFVIHRTVLKFGDANMPPWCVTHMLTGCRAGVFATRERARAVAKSLAAVRGAKWDELHQFDGVRQWPKPVRKRCREIIGKASMR